MAGAGPARLAAALLGGLLLMPAAGAAPQGSAIAGAAVILGGVIQLEPNGVQPLPRSAATDDPAAAGLPPASLPAKPEAVPSPVHPNGGATRAKSMLSATGTVPASGGSPTAAQPAATERSRAGTTAAGSPEPRPAAAVVAGEASPAAGAPAKPASVPAGSRPGVLMPQGGGRPADAASPTSTASQRELVLDRRHRQLVLIENGTPLRRFPVAVGMPGWETPVGRFAVIEKLSNPVWEHPVSGLRIQPGPDNPLGSRWIGFYRDCRGRRGFNGKEHLVVQGCVVAGFHGTPNRASIGRAASHGCVRLYDEHVRDLFDLVRVGTPVTVLP